MDKLEVRYARPGDYDAIIHDLNTVYGGHDYLIANYHVYLHDKHVHCFVGEIDGKMVAFRGIFRDGKKEAVLFGARVNPRFQNKKIFKRFHDITNAIIEKKFPSLEAFTWTAMDKDTFPLQRDDVVERWYYPFWLTSKQNVLNLIDALEHYRETLPVFSPSQEECVDLLTAQYNSNYIFPSGYITGFYNWLPLKITTDNLRHFVACHHVLASLASPREIAAVSFLTSHQVPKGIMSGIHYYQKGADFYTFLSHLKYHLKNVVRIADDRASIVLNIRPSSGVDVHRLNTIINPYLGKSLKDEIFHHDSGHFAKLARKAKL